MIKSSQMLFFLRMIIVNDLYVGELNLLLCQYLLCYSYKLNEKEALGEGSKKDKLAQQCAVASQNW